MKSSELQEKISQRIKSLAEATDQALASEQLAAWLRTMSRFHRYSAQNTLLILFARPDATRVAGFNAWHKLNRYVKKGAKGIPILAPLVVKNDAGETGVKGFKVVYVFDISDTDGEPLPDAPDWKSPERQLELEARLIQLAESKGIKVERTELHGQMQGVSRHGLIQLAEGAGTKTLIHEIAHEMMHWDEKPVQFTGVGTQNEELEAETVAWIVADHFGIEGLQSANYLAIYAIDSDKIMKRMERIRKVAAEIITFLEGVPTPEPTLELA